MARKDFDEYLTKVSKQYVELNSMLQELSEEVNNGMYEPERLDQLKATIAPVKQSFDTLNYIRYLLDKPTRKSKHAKYNRQCARVLASTQAVNQEAVLAKNASILESIKK